MNILTEFFQASKLTFVASEIQKNHCKNKICDSLFYSVLNKLSQTCVLLYWSKEDGIRTVLNEYTFVLSKNNLRKKFRKNKMRGGEVIFWFSKDVSQNATYILNNR